MANHDVTATIAVINSGIANFTSKNLELMTKLASDQGELLSDIDKMQTHNIKAGFLPDDGDDIKSAVAEILEEVTVNLGELQKSIEAWAGSVGVIVDAPGIMRVNKTMIEEERANA
jgi:hypothetical protein